MLFGIGIVTLGASVSIVMPHRWMAALHVWLGLSGELPDLPITGYLTRSLSAFYVFFGVLFLYLGNRVTQYLQLIHFLAHVGLGLAVVMTWICLAVGLPWWWTVAEAVFLFCYFTALWLSSKAAMTQNR